ncbi:hypothetical protein JOF53_008210 [Crossiella equi]|uniref:Glycosyltransferase RgtA/B/C/D-like domain-containing protein n=1 Tax=Crossiella equi TaxID=130796 RepID=A0ABS5ARY9_9PSEU|nr:glycosyltransferase family 39 protein [Crossiella equi]MBP2479338.1 hypothetical protein [Crossiella equi]
MPRPAWAPVLVTAAAVTGLLLAFAGRYGYNVDELYFRLLGERGWAWGYVDQPPLVPALVELSAGLFGDTPFGIRVPAALCAGGTVVLAALLTAELGGTRRAQLLCAFGSGTSFLVLSIGHVLVTSTVDLLAWGAILLCAVRALRRSQPRWWLLAGVLCGLALYAKYIMLLLPVSLVLALALAGPRTVFRDRNFLGGAGLAVLVGAPNLVYQLANDLPQLRMAQALGSSDGQLNWVLFLPWLPFMLGPLLTVVWVAGLVRLLRSPDWRPVRAVAVAAGIAVALALAGGGRPDYVGGLVLGLFAAGCVPLDDWLRGRGRAVLLTAGALVSVPLQLVLALPVLPEDGLGLAAVNNINAESIGWPRLVAQVGQAYRALPEAERARTTVLAHNIGESGALDRYGPEHGLPQYHSGHNELHRHGPPPEGADQAVAVGIPLARLNQDFAQCQVVSTVDNGVGLENAEQGVPITVCRGRKAPWAELWPHYHYLSG